MALEPHVSVVLPARAPDVRLAESAASVLGQTADNLEVLVVLADGAHRDRFVLDDPRLRVVSGSDVSTSRVALINRGVGAAHAPWLAFIEPGFLWSSDHLWSSLLALEQSDAQSVWSRILAPGAARLAARRADRPRRITTEALLEGHEVALSTVVCSRSALLDVGGFSSVTALDAERALWLRMSIRSGIYEAPTATTVSPRGAPPAALTESDAMVKHATLVDFLLWLKSPGAQASTSPGHPSALPAPDEPGRLA